MEHGPCTEGSEAADRIFSDFASDNKIQAEPKHQPQIASNDLNGEHLCNKGTGLILEIFAGTCRLSKACRGLGLQALSVDKDVNRAENAVVAKYDLCDSNQFSTLEKLVRSERHRLCSCAFCAKLRYSVKGKGETRAGIAKRPAAQAFAVE